MQSGNYNLLNQDENEGKELANKHLEMVKEALEEHSLLNQDVRKVSDLTIPEFKMLMVECFEMLKQRELDTSMIEYKKLWKNEKPETEDIFVKDGTPIGKEW